MLRTLRAVAVIHRAFIKNECSLSRLIFSSSTCLTPTTTHSVIAAARCRFVSALDCCSDLRHMNQAHAVMLASGLDLDDRIFTRFVETASSLGHASYAFSVFCSRRQVGPDLFLCNVVISSLAHTNLAAAAAALYNRIQTLGLRPDQYSIPSVLKAAAYLGDVGLGRQIHGQATLIGFATELYVRTGLVRMYGACGQIRKAQALLDELPLEHVMLWNAVLAAYAKARDVVRTRELFDQAPERNLVTWTTVISVCAQENYPSEAIRLFQRMQIEDVIVPDEVALLAALSACADLGSLELGERIHSYIVRHVTNMVAPLMNALIDMYAKSGDIRKALQVFESMNARTTISWSTMISGLALHGLSTEALDMFHRMEADGVSPNEVVFLAVLTACSHAGLVDDGRWYIDQMTSKYYISPRVEHYGCMVDLLGRAGKLDQAKDMVESMPYEPNAAIFGSLLAASRTHRDVDIGEYALRYLIEIEPQNSGNYSILSNIYASKGIWNASREVRKLMRDMGVKKDPGNSYIEVNGTIHEFLSSDGSHSQSKELYEILAKINMQIKECSNEGSKMRVD